MSPPGELLIAQTLTITHLYEGPPFIYSPAEQPLNAKDEAGELNSQPPLSLFNSHQSGYAGYLLILEQESLHNSAS